MGAGKYNGLSIRLHAPHRDTLDARRSRSLRFFLIEMPVLENALETRPDALRSIEA